MAKGKHRTRTGFRPVPARRVISRNANFSRPILLPRRILPSLSLTQIEDRRRYHPHGVNRSFRSVYGHRVIPRSIIRYRPYSGPSIGRRFPLLADLSEHRVLPRDAVICARRKIRREVLIALGHAGRAGQRRPKFNDNSNVRCR